jgi:hypothetical protein
LTPIAGHRATENRLRHYARLRRFPDGVVAVGDAFCAFNPVYAQGMTAAALGAEVLDRWLREGSSHRGLGRSRDFQRRLARATASAWRLSAGADYRFRAVDGPPQGRVARLTGCYIAGVMRGATRQPWVRRRLEEVLHLLRPPSALFGAGVLARLAWDRLAGRADAGDRRLTHPRVVHTAGDFSVIEDRLDLKARSESVHLFSLGSKGPSHAAQSHRNVPDDQPHVS